MMAPLEKALRAVGVIPLYSFTRRVSVEESDGEGGVRMMKVFRHIAFVEGIG